MKGIPVIVFTPAGSYAKTIGPDHPEYETIRARDYEAGLVNDRWNFEHKVLRNPIQMLLAQLTGAP